MMREFFRPLSLILLLVGLLVLPASPAGAARYEPGDMLSLSGEVTATVTLHDVVFYSPVGAYLPRYVTVQGRAFVTDNDTGIPVGMMRVDWRYDTYLSTDRNPYARVGPFTSVRTGFQRIYPGPVTSEAILGPARGQFKDMLYGPQTPTSTMTLTMQPPAASSAGGLFTFTGVPAHIDFEINF